MEMHVERLFSRLRPLFESRQMSHYDHNWALKVEMLKVADQVKTTRTAMINQQDWTRDSIGYNDPLKAFKSCDELGFGAAARLFRLCCEKHNFTRGGM